MKLLSYILPEYPVLLVTALGGLFAAVDLAPAQSWASTTSPVGPWRTVACSADGLKLVATGWAPNPTGYRAAMPTPIYTSADSGTTWTRTTAPSNSLTSVASSADGTIWSL